MKWTTDKPTAPGHYWSRCAIKKGKPFVVRIEDWADGDLSCSWSGSEDIDDLKSVDGYEWWPIPIPEPVES